MEVNFLPMKIEREKLKVREVLRCGYYEKWPLYMYIIENGICTWLGYFNTFQSE